MKKINDFTTTVFISIILLAIISMLSFTLNYEMNRFKDELQIAYDGLQTTHEEAVNLGVSSKGVWVLIKKNS